MILQIGAIASAGILVTLLLLIFVFLTMLLITFFIALKLEWGDSWITNKEEQKSAFQSGAEKRLDEVIKKSNEVESSINTMKKNVSLLSDEIWDMQPGEETREKQVKIDFLNETIKDKQKELRVLEDQKLQAQEVVLEYENRKKQTQKKRRFYFNSPWNNDFFPLLNIILIRTPVSVLKTRPVFQQEGNARSCR